MRSLLVSWFTQRPRFVPDIPAMAGCQHCKRIVSLRAANRLTIHLIRHHEFEEMKAYETVDWVFQRMQEHLKNKGIIDLTPL